MLRQESCFWNMTGAYSFLVLLLAYSSVGEAQQYPCKPASIPATDAYFTLIVDQTEADCSTNSTRAIHIVETVRSAVDNVNKKENFSIGFRILDACSTPGFNPRIVNAFILPDQMGRILEENAANPLNNAGSAKHLGILNAGSSDALLEIAKALSGRNMAAVTIRPVPSRLNDLPNMTVLTTASSIEVYATAVMDIAKKKKWKCLSVIYENSLFGREAHGNISKLAQNRGVCIAVTAVLTSVENVGEICDKLDKKGVPRRVLYLGESWNKLVEEMITRTRDRTPGLEYILSDPTGPLQDSSENKLNSALRVTPRNYTNQIVEAVSTLSTGYKLVKAEGLQVGESMESKLFETLRNVSFTASRGGYRYTVNYDNGQAVRSVNHSLAIKYSDKESLYRPEDPNSFDLPAPSSTMPSDAETCNTECLWCYEKELQYVYQPGRYMILVTLPVHNEVGDTWNCKAFDTNGVIYSEVVRYSVERVSAITGIEFGFVILDSCYNALRVSTIIPEIVNGHITISRTINGIPHKLDPKSIIVTISDLSSDVTIAVQNIMKHLNIMQISYGATTSLLDNNTKLFPYFLRTVPSDRQQARNMVQLLKKYGLTAFQLIYTSTTYGMTGAELVKEFAEKEGICLVYEKQISKQELDSEQKSELVAELRDTVVSILDTSKLGVTAVIYFGEEAVITKIIRDHLNSYLYPERKRMWKENGLFFIGSEVWGVQQSVLENHAGAVIRGSLTVDLQRNFQIAPTRRDEIIKNDFWTYLADRKSVNSRNDIWFETMSTSFATCPFTELADNTGSCLGCPGADGSSSKSVNLESLVNVEDAFAVHMSKAIFAVGYGLHKLASERSCRLNNINNCSYFDHHVHIKEIYKALKKTKIPLNTYQATQVGADENLHEVFDADGNGNAGYEIYNVQKTAPDVFGYKPGLSFDSDGKITDEESILFYTYSSSTYEDKSSSNVQSTCFDPVCHSICFSENPSPPPTPQPTPVPERDVIARVTVVVTATTLAIVVLILVERILTRRSAYYLKKQEKEDRKAALDVGPAFNPGGKGASIYDQSNGFDGAPRLDGILNSNSGTGYSVNMNGTIQRKPPQENAIGQERTNNLQNTGLQALHTDDSGPIPAKRVHINSFLPDHEGTGQVPAHSTNQDELMSNQHGNEPTTSHGAGDIGPRMTRNPQDNSHIYGSIPLNNNNIIQDSQNETYELEAAAPLDVHAHVNEGFVSTNEVHL